MKLSVSLDTQIVTPSSNPLRIKAGSKVPCEVTFTRNSRPVPLESPLVELAIKPSGAFDADLLVFHNAFSSAAHNAYVGTVNCDTSNLVDALGLGDGSVATDKPQIEASGEIAWTVNGETFRSATFPVIVEAPIANSGAQPVPATPPYPEPAGIEVVSRKGQPYGYAALDEQGKVPAAQIGDHDHEIARIVGLQDSLDTKLSLDPDGKVHRNVLVPEGVAISDVGGSIWATDVGTATNLDLRLMDIEGVVGKVGLANGLCPLGTDTKIPHGYLPESILGATKFQGIWNAATNQPSIPAASSGNNGWYFIVTTEGATAVNGINDWKLGDWILSIGTTWVKVDNTDAVITINGKTGIVTLGKTDIGLGNVENVALSTWTGSGNLTSTAVGTLGTAATEMATMFSGASSVTGAVLDWALGTYFTLAPNFNTTLAFANVRPGKSILVAYTNSSGFGVNWPAGVVWLEGTPALLPPASQTTYVSFTATSTSTVAGRVLPSGSNPLAVATGGTGATSATGARSALGLGNVDNTSDANKPVSTAQAAALAGKVGTDGTVQNVVSLTQVQYNALNPKVSTTLYVIVG